ncbi:MAG TPA: arginine deiminase family protein [Thermoanaerobaculia bacterium]
MAIALTRALSPRISECELTYLDREPIDYVRAAAQHEAYERLLEKHGCTLVHVDPAPEHPDGVFVEDAAIVVDEVAVITRPGAESRRGETDSVAKVLARYRPLFQIEAPATIDGGDVLRVGRKLFVGRGQRTNNEGIAQLRNCLAPFGYQVIATAFHGCLHLKSAVTMLDERTLLFNPDWVDAIDGFEMISVDSAEPFAANVLRRGSVVIAGAEQPRTNRLLEQRGYKVDIVAMSELLRAEAGVTCCSVVF